MSQTFFEVPPDFYCTSANTTWRTASLMQNLRQLFLLDPILCRFRIVRCNRQAALPSAMNNYTPLVIEGADKNKQLTNMKPTQTGINRNKWTFLNYKIIGAPKKFKNQLRPLDRPGSVNFCQNFWNLSHETVPLRPRYRITSRVTNDVASPLFCCGSVDPRTFGGGGA